MTTIADSRASLESVLATSGLRVVPQGVASPPSVFIAPGNSWITPSQLAFGRAEINWVIVCIVAAANEVAISDIEALAQSVMASCNLLPTGWGNPVIGAPGVITLAGLTYLGFRVEVKGVL